MNNSLYHGTTERGAEKLRNHGILESELQKRDKGLFGKGLYVTTDKNAAHRHATTRSDQTNGTPEVITIEVDNRDVFSPGDILPNNSSIKPQRIPDWHDDFIEWHLNKIQDAAVWETISSVSEEEIIERAEKEMTPKSDQFKREEWYCQVTEYGFDTGYTVIEWLDTEIIIRPQTQITVCEK